MSCRRAYEIDLPAFLEDASGPAFADFRAHYPGCAACAAEVRAWTELDLQLRTAVPGGASHPEPERLAAYARDAQALAPGQRGGLEAHLARCRACRDELSALRTFLASGVPTVSEAADTDAQSPAARWLAVLRGLLWQPAFAYALLAAALVPTLYRALGPGGAAEREVAFLLSEEETSPEAPARARTARETRFRKDAPAVSPDPDAGGRPSGQGAADAAEAPPPEPGAEPLGEMQVDRLRALGYHATEPNAEVGPEAAPPDAVAKSQAPRAARPSRHRAPAAAEPAVPAVTLRPDAVVEVQRPQRSDELRLRVPVGDRAPGTRAEVVVTDPSGARELRERHTLASGATWLEVALPVSWLVPGSYRVRVAPGEGGGVAVYVFELVPPATAAPR